MSWDGVFVFDRDWVPHLTLMEQADMIVDIRLDQKCSMRQLLEEAQKEIKNLPKNILPWLWLNAIIITLEEMLKKPPPGWSGPSPSSGIPREKRL
ncbi:uncharacterized protein F4822DRAFT_433857 [Hypoxylon trugodes]|uniref:uncharacterized protein n=1 Tax=Hypoxylon trugodes TaxID=326681 RepID=UPI00218CB7BD|nr:uncharacterized protein F4822DRAFT_433857 [Hypoxylon trugodes]KAI1383909.1 hypothetical protein F4822DRAFT_433857 [Hypoxylon trugodes]